MGHPGNLIYRREHGFFPVILYMGESMGLPVILHAGESMGIPVILRIKGTHLRGRADSNGQKPPRTRGSSSLPQHGPGSARLFQKAGHPAPAVR